MRRFCLAAVSSMASPKLPNEHQLGKFHAGIFHKLIEFHADNHSLVRSKLRRAVRQLENQADAP